MSIRNESETHFSICLSAFDTEIAIQKEAREGRRVGYLTWEGFENTDYSTGTYIVAQYYDDPRTFAIYDKGIVNLLKMNLTDVIK